MSEQAGTAGAPRRGSGRREQIVAVALALLEERGRAGLTMRRLAERLGMRAPSLYKHFRDKEALEAALVEGGLEAIAAELEAAAERARDPLADLAAAYRRFALARPHLYRLMSERPLPRERLPEGLEARGAAPVLGAAGSLDRALAAWAFAHGMVALELAGRFPPGADLDAVWREGVAAFAAALPSAPPAAGEPQPARPIVRSLRGPD